MCNGGSAVVQRHICIYAFNQLDEWHWQWKAHNVGRTMVPQTVCQVGNLRSIKICRLASDKNRWMRCARTLVCKETNQLANSWEKSERHSFALLKYQMYQRHLHVSTHKHACLSLDVLRSTAGTCESSEPHYQNLGCKTLDAAFEFTLQAFYYQTLLSYADVNQPQLFTHKS